MNELPFIGLPIWTIAKWLAVFAFIIYSVFALVVVRQVRLMIDTLNVEFERPILLLSYAHLLFAAGVLILALVIL